MKTHSSSLPGRFVRLEALSLEHLDGLCDCLLHEPEGWFAQQVKAHLNKLLT